MKPLLSGHLRDLPKCPLKWTKSALFISIFFLAANQLVYKSTCWQQHQLCTLTVSSYDGKIAGERNFRLTKILTWQFKKLKKKILLKKANYFLYCCVQKAISLHKCINYKHAVSSRSVINTCDFV